ncbi:MAG: energy transducer TonB [Candidatus Methylomirabilis oxyfera]|nr:energy transducer TonB [Candidatus Methylomirabilis oxyfera]
MLVAEHPQIRNFIVVSLLAHLAFIGLLSAMQRSAGVPADRPLQVRIVDQSVRTQAVPPPDRRTLGTVTARAHRLAKKAGLPRTPDSVRVRRLASAFPRRAATPPPPSAKNASPGAPSPASHQTALTPWTPPPLRTLQGAAAAPNPKAAHVEPLEGEGVGGSTRPSNLRGQMAMLWKSLDARQYPGQGADTGEEGDTGSSNGPTVSLDSRDSRFASYLMGVKRQIERVWSYPPDARGLTGNLVITFGITRDGRLSDLQLTQTSGIAPLDNEAIRAIRLANPFGPFSEQMRFERLNIRAAFYYHVSRASLRDQ